MKVTASATESREVRLVEKLRSGDSSAVEEFYNTYRKKLYYLILEQVDRNQAVTEDLVQEVFLAALGSLDKFRGESRLYTWLRSIAFHKINDFYRRQAREPRPEEPLPGTDAVKLEQAADNEPAVFSAMESEETRQEVRQALVDLPEDYQEVLVLKYLEDLPVVEISQVMGRSPKSVEGLLSRARKAMRDNLAANNRES
jgi:RNA polymerase sigma-70 factor (ECF subfamily)